MKRMLLVFLMIVVVAMESLGGNVITPAVSIIYDMQP